jgi:hypothetical protein
MGGIGLAYRGGILSQASGGGAPPGDATVWPAVADWAALSTVGTPRRVGDRVPVSSIGPGNAFGIAQWTGSSWDLVYAMFDAFADLDDFSESIQTGAIAGVGTGSEPSLMRYTYDGAAWVRNASDRPVVWSSSDLDAIGNVDPSGIGVTLPGDVLRLTMASGIGVYRLVRFTTAGGSVLDADVWVPAHWAETGTLKLWAQLVGDEGSRTGTGYTDSTAGGSSSIAGNVSSSGYTRLTSVGGGTNAQLIVTGLSLGQTQQVYFRARMRGTASGANAAAGPYGADGANVSYPQMYNSTAFQFHETNGADLNNTTLRSGGSVLPTTSNPGDMIEMLDEGRAVVSTITRNGAMYHTAKRNQAALVSSVSAWAAASGGVLDVRHAVVITRAP